MGLFVIKSQNSKEIKVQNFDVFRLISTNYNPKYNSTSKNSYFENFYFFRNFEILWYITPKNTYFWFNFIFNVLYLNLIFTRLIVLTKWKIFFIGTNAIQCTHRSVEHQTSWRISLFSPLSLAYHSRFLCKHFFRNCN